MLAKNIAILPGRGPIMGIIGFFMIASLRERLPYTTYTRWRKEKLLYLHFPEVNELPTLDGADKIAQFNRIIFPDLGVCANPFNLGPEE